MSLLVAQIAEASATMSPTDRANAVLSAAEQCTGAELHRIVQRLRVPPVSFQDNIVSQFWVDMLARTATLEGGCGPELVLQALLPSAPEPQVWTALCQVTTSCAEDVRFGLVCRAQTFASIVTTVNVCPQQVPDDDTMIRAGLVALSSILEKCPFGGRFLLLPAAVAATRQHNHGGHWALIPAVTRAEICRRHLASRLYSGGFRPICCTNELLAANSQTTSTWALTAENVDFEAQRMLSMLRHDVDQDWLKQSVGTGEQRLLAKRALSFALAEEIFETMKLCGGELASGTGGAHFGRWIQIADLMYACARDELVDVGTVLTKVIELLDDRPEDAPVTGEGCCWGWRDKKRKHSTSSAQGRSLALTYGCVSI